MVRSALNSPIDLADTLVQLHRLRSSGSIATLLVISTFRSTEDPRAVVDGLDPLDAVPENIPFAVPYGSRYRLKAPRQRSTPSWQRPVTGLFLPKFRPSGFGGVSGTPFLVMTAKFPNSCATEFRQASLLFAPVAPSTAKLKRLSVSPTAASLDLSWHSSTPPSGESKPQISFTYREYSFFLTRYSPKRKIRASDFGPKLILGSCSGTFGVCL
jgi:hypothetical protein